MDGSFERGTPVANAKSAAAPSPPPPPKLSTNVQVVVRCRPSSLDERQRGVSEIVLVDEMSEEVRVTAPIKAGEKVFNYDRVFGPQSSQIDIYEKAVEPLVQQTLRGYNATVLAYGQTGTGKTHTMEGEFDDPLEMGIIPRAMQSIFRTLDLKNDTESYVKASYLEIYNENLTDLLSTVPSTTELPPNQQLRLVDDKTRSTHSGRGGVIVHNLEEVLVKSYEDVRKVMKLAMSKRRVASTDLNERSSRSHAVFTVTVHSKELSAEGEELLRVGKLNLVDLAGSECVARSGSKDLRAREAGNINQSLLSLGRVITALVEKSPHIAYRDSKLTRVLQESLGGSSLTLMIATVAPSVICLDETLSTLEYASRAKSIKNKPVANQRMTKRAAIKDYVEEIERLRLELQSARSKDGVHLSEEQYNAMVLASKSTFQRVSDLESTVEKRNAELETMRKAYATIKAELTKTGLELDAERDRLAKSKEDLRQKQEELAQERLAGEEKQAIVDAHVAVEARLHQIHDELQDRLQQAKNRITGLHDKLERKQQMELENERNVAQLRRNVESKLGEIDTLVRDGRSIALENSDKVSSMVERFRVLLGEEVIKTNAMHRDRLAFTARDALAKNLDYLSKTVQSDRQRVEREGRANADAFASASSAFDTGAKLHAECFELGASAHRAEVDMLRHSCIEPLVAELERSKRSERALVDSLFLATSSLRESTAELVLEYEAKLAELQKEMVDMVRKEKERSRKASEKAASRVAAMLSGLQDECDNQLDGLLHDLGAGKEHITKHGSQRAATLDACISVLVQGNETWISNELAVKQACVDEVRQNDAFALMSANEAKEHTEEKSMEMSTTLQSGASESKAAHARLESATKATVAELKERERACRAEFAQQQQVLDDLVRTSVADEALLEQRGSQMLTLGKQELHALRAGTDEFCDASLGKVQDSKRIVSSFTFGEDRPTGKTPSKLQVLDWSRERPRTAPHSMIVERVRESRTGRGSAGFAQSAMGDIEDVSFSTRKKKTGMLLSERDCNTDESVKGEDLRAMAAAAAGGAVTMSKEKAANTTNRRLLRQHATTAAASVPLPED